jgi:hypothetical protein
LAAGIEGMEVGTVTTGQEQSAEDETDGAMELEGQPKIFRKAFLNFLIVSHFRIFSKS